MNFVYETQPNGSRQLIIELGKNEHFAANDPTTHIVARLTVLLADQNQEDRISLLQRMGIPQFLWDWAIDPTRYPQHQPPHQMMMADHG